MAPEQFQGARADERTDQFNFCAALYKALYGQRPFSQASGEPMTLGALAREVIAGNLRPPLTTDVPEVFFAIVRRGLSRDRADRYPSMGALLEALVAALEQVAPPVVDRPARRGWRVGVAVGLAGALLAAGGSMLVRRAPARRAPLAGVTIETPPAPPAPAATNAPPAPVSPALSLASAAPGELPRRRPVQPHAPTRPRSAPRGPTPAPPSNVVAPPDTTKRLGFKLKDPFASQKP
jgi:hypothetical protein